MLAGCSSALLSPRHRLKSEASVSFQACHLQVQEKIYPSQQKMSTQRFDLSCNLSRREAPRVTLSLDKPLDTIGNCSFRQNTVSSTSSSSSLVAQSVSWDARREIESGFWFKKEKSLKRFIERPEAEDPGIDRAKRKKSSSNTQLIGSEDIWFTHVIEEPPLVEEERAFFVPNAAIFPPLPSSSNALGGAFDTEIADKGENNVGTSEGTGDKAKSDSSSSSDTLGSSPNLNEGSSENETGNGSYQAQLSGAAGVSCGDESTQTAEHQGLELVNLLVACVESICSQEFATTNYILARLGELASPEGTPIHRIAAYFTEALVLRVVKMWPHLFSIVPPRRLVDHVSDDDLMAFRLLNHVSPIPKFLHFTLNEKLLNSFEGKDRVHIIDFDIQQGFQWPSLFQSFATRTNPPSHVRITGIGDSKQELQETGARLLGIAEALNLPFEFHAVVDRLEDVRLWMLHVKEEESVAVNCVLQLHKVLYDDNGSVLIDFLGLIRSTNPEIILIAEQEAAHNEPRWDMRFAKSLQYYSAIFDSIDCSLPLDSPARIKVEEMFAKEIRNIVSCEGSDRIERHEPFGKWRGLMEERGFCCVGTHEREILQSQMLLKMFSFDKFHVETLGEESDGGLTLKWLDQPLYTVSAWKPVDIAGSSSSVSQPN